MCDIGTKTYTNKQDTHVHFVVSISYLESKLLNSLLNPALNCHTGRWTVSIPLVQNSRPVLGYALPPIQRILRTLFAEVKRPASEADRSCLSSASSDSCWRYTSYADACTNKAYSYSVALGLPWHCSHHVAQPLCGCATRHKCQRVAP
jgi:hypothetical protein